MILHIIETDGRLNEVTLSPDIDNRETFQTVVKSGSWFAASIDKRSSYSLYPLT
jgi:predicted cupin superfamily sugar epimerase